jgi:tRNA(Ile)-lysidine synthase
MSDLIKKVQNTAFQNNLWKKGSRIVLGVSGGPDSVCLLDIFSQLAPKYDLNLIIAHVNYDLRGKDSQKDEKLTRQLAKKYSIPIVVMNPKIKKISESALRDVRYDFFERVRIENNFNLIAVAHNLDDQVETFLMRLIRGSGLKGLSAMQYKSGKIVRPFLGTPRVEIIKYLKDKKLTYRMDKTNKTDMFFRNKIRNRLIPFLEKNFNPQTKKTISNATFSIADDYSLIQELTEGAYENKKYLSVKKFLKLHPALQKRVLLRLIFKKKPDGKDVEASHVSEMIKAIKSTKGKNQVVLFKGLKMTRKGDKVIISNQ